MKIVKLHSKLDKNGYYPIPKNMVNRLMFCYPYYRNKTPETMVDLMINKNVDEHNKKINAIVCYYGELFGKRLWSIGMMGYDHLIIFNDKGVEIDVYYKNYIFNNGRILYILNGEADYLKYYNNEALYLRMEKIDKITRWLG